MSRNVVCVAPDLSVEGLTTLLLERGLSAVPVITEDGRLVGVASTTDLLREVQDRGEEQERIPLRVSDRAGVQMALGDGFHATCLAHATVGEIMTPLAITLPATASVAQAAALMTLNGVGHLLVVDPGRKVVGIVTALDVMRWLAQQSGLSILPGQAEAEDNRTTTDRLLASQAELATWLALGAALPAVPDCPDCRRIVLDVCGNSLVQQSWFRLAPARSCTTHHEGRALEREHEWDQGPIRPRASGGSTV